MATLQDAAAPTPSLSASAVGGDVEAHGGVDGASSSIQNPVSESTPGTNAAAMTSKPAASSPQPQSDEDANDDENDGDDGDDDDDDDDDDAGPKLPIRDKEGFMRVVVDRFQTRDWIHSSLLSESQIRLEKDTRDALSRVSDYRTYKDFYAQYPGRLYGEGYRGYGNGYTENGTTTKLVYPAQKLRPGRRSTPTIKFSKREMKKQAEQCEDLVPIRIDVDWEKIKLRDTFTFNLHERLISAEVFAAQLVEDMGLKPPLADPVYQQVVQQVQEQLSDYYPFAFSEEEALDPELPYSAYKNDEMRILIKLNITIGAHTLVDQFEWELNNPLNSPEEFAACMARDLSLSGEFMTAIAHCIREQAQLFTRSLYSIGHSFDGRPIEDPDLVGAFLPSPLPSVFRPQQQAKDFAPYLYENTEAELERSETMFSREQRRNKRSITRRGGPQLPDLKERQRTIRTSIVSSVLPGAALDIEESRLFKRATNNNAGRNKRTAHNGEISDSDDSDDSMPDSPAMSHLQQGTRTRGIRGAATAAAQRMANIGRSETPEAVIHHQETRTSRRFGREATREQTEEPHQYMVTLRVNPTRLRKFMRDLKLRQSTSATATPNPAHQRPPGAAVPGSMGPPSTTPSAPARNAPPPAHNPPSQVGRVPAPPVGPNGAAPNVSPPPPPDWLVKALAELKRSYGNDQFEGFMRFFAVHSETGQFMSLPLKPEDMSSGKATFCWLPRIRCLDCTGKSYTVGPEQTVQNFEVHLKNKDHTKRVRARLEGRSPSVVSNSSKQGGGPAQPTGSAPPPSSSPPAPSAPVGGNNGAVSSSAS